MECKARSSRDVEDSQVDWFLQNLIERPSSVSIISACCRLLQYVARPPEISSTAPVVNEHSAELQNATSEAISSTLTKRPFGIFESIKKSMCCCVICANRAVRAAAGVMQLTVMS